MPDLGVGTMFLVDDILLAPVYGVAWLGRKIKEVAENELTDETKVHEELLELQIRLDQEEIGLKEYERQEEVLMRRLDEIRKLKERLAK
jgi:hypothetical protein